ncbi:AroM family protein [bacterium]|nr:AroM family protein [bacterium]
MKIGGLTIGQAPRDDVAREFQEAAGEGVELIQAGALDGLTREAIAACAPDPARPGVVLVTRLLDGTEVALDEALILPLLRAGIGRLEEVGVSSIALFCTGEFPPLETSVPLLRPDRILAHFLKSVAGGEDGSGETGNADGRAGTGPVSGFRGARAASRPRIVAVVPSPLQIDEMKGKWARQGLAVEAAALSPYSSTPAQVEAAARAVALMEPTLVVLDCIGYTRAMKRAFIDACHVPVVLPRTLLGRAAAELAH